MDRKRNTQKVSNEAVQPARKTARLMHTVKREETGA
jgi:hypothetical protein